MVKMRNLKASDIFPMVTILNKIGFKQIKEILTPEKLKEMVKMFKEDQEDQEQTEDPDGLDKTTILGFNVIFEVLGLLMDNLPKIEQDLYKFLGNLSGMTPQEVADLPMGEFTGMILTVLKSPEFKDFFKGVSEYIS